MLNKHLANYVKRTKQKIDTVALHLSRLTQTILVVCEIVTTEYNIKCERMTDEKKSAARIECTKKKFASI